MSQTARERFPRGLAQPAAGHRFGADALLLAAFAHPGRGPVLDLGAGSGAVGLGLALRGEKLVVHALEIETEALACACENARRLGLSERWRAVPGDVRAIREIVPAESCGQVVCNPPWFRPGRGRMSPLAARERARAETGALLGDFAAAASFVLPERGRAAFIVAAGRLADMLAAFAAHGLAAKRLVCVHPKVDAPARFALLEARKGGRPGLAVEAPLVLHDASGALSAQALAMCPWLASGRGPGGRAGVD